VLRPLEPWQHEPAVTKEQVLRMRSEFWDTQPHYGGSRGALALAVAASSPPSKCSGKHPSCSVREGGCLSDVSGVWQRYGTR
jgi:hypothetical protein